MKPKISILVPFYNVSSYIERCVHSLMQQTFQDIEYIFIDDASTDNSYSLLLSVISQYPSREHQICIIRHTDNQGTASSRNDALEASTGDFIGWCDADDWVENDYYSSLYEVATSQNADLVVCDFYHDFQDDSFIERFQEFDSFQELIDNRSAYWWGLFCRFMHRSLFECHQLRFYTGVDMWEDVGLSVRLHYFSKNTRYLHRPLYHYNRTNPISILNQDQSSSSDKHELYDSQRGKCIKLLTNFLVEHHLSPEKFQQKARISTIDSILVEGSLQRINASYRDLIPFFMHRTELSFLYRLTVSCAMLGFTLPLRLYRFLSSIRRS